jgi:hypothetical protein
MKTLTLAALLLFAIPLMAQAEAPVENLWGIGRGTAIVFSPDLAVPGNREFYEALGFLYLETPDWREVVDTLAAQPKGSVHTLVVESHGANGNGMKLQTSKEPAALRSYAAVGALQYALQPTSVRRVLLSACNAGRLFRPSIYNRLDRFVGDPLFLPATLGILDAPAGFRPARSSVRVLRRRESKLETLIEGDFAELPQEGPFAVERKGEKRFVISTMLIQHILRDDSLKLVSKGYETSKSSADLTREECERLFDRFVRFLQPQPLASDGAPSAAR